MFIYIQVSDFRRIKHFLQM